MLLKYSSYQKRSKLTSGGKAQRSTGNVKALHGKGKGNRKGLKGGLANKRIKAIANRREEIAVLPVDASDNSNDSGLGFDHHLEFQIPKTIQTSYLEPEYCWPEADEAKKQRLDIKLESDNANDDFTFPQTRVVNPTPAVTVCGRGKGVSTGKNLKRSNQANSNQSVGISRDGKVQLVILSQPETQHRARYQTEGSRGAVKDRTGNGFPIVKLNGYNKPATLEVYIGTDQGRVAPHMFYQACRVSGKNSTPCIEKKVEGTVLIEIELDPMKDMIATCDCVGILKERNVDVEHRFPEESSGRSKKKSTRCRMIFKTVITNSDNTQETIQVTSQPIICTQPPGIPEISKKSLSSCPVTGGLELFILGKNFLKDTKVVFTEGDVGSDNYWQSVVQPDKEFLQQSHLVCVIPPYKVSEIKEPVAVKLIVLSSGRNSEPHTFFYSPVGTPPLQAIVQEPSVTARAITQNLPPTPSYNGTNLLMGVPLIPMGSNNLPSPPSQFMSEENCKLPVKEELGAIHPVILMPPPTLLPLSVRRSSQPPPALLISDGVELKREVESPVVVSSASDLSTSQTPSLATIQRFVSSNKLPSLSVENYFSKIENKPLVTSDVAPSLLATTTSLVSTEERIIQDQLAASIAKEAEAATKLDEFVNSTVEAHLSPNRDLKPKPELLMNDVNVPIQTSPLNCTFENVHVSPTHMNEQLLSSSQNAMCGLLAEQTVQSVTPVLNESSSSMLLNSTFSPGKDIHSVTMSSQYQDMSITTSSTTSPVSSSADIIMKSVVNDLNQTSPFSTSPEVLIEPTITSPIVSVTSPIRHTMMMATQFSNPDRSEPMSIGTTDFVPAEPMSIDQKCDSSNSASFQPSMFVQRTSETNAATIVPHFSPQGISVVSMPPTVQATALDPPYSQSLVYSSPEMPTTSDKISMSQNSFEVIPTTSISATTFSEPDRPETSVATTPQFAMNGFTTASVVEAAVTLATTVTHSSVKTDQTSTTSNESNVVVTNVTGEAVGVKSVPTTATASQQSVKKCEEGIPLHELAQMSEQDLLIYINPSCFDQV